MKQPMNPYDKDIFWGGIVLSAVSVMAILLPANGMYYELFPYPHSPKLYVFSMLISIIVCVGSIAGTVYSYKRYLKEKQCEPHPRKQTFLLIWESVCLCVNIAVFVLVIF